MSARCPQRRVFIGEETTLTVSLVNRKPVPLGRLDIEDETPDEIEIRGRGDGSGVESEDQHDGSPDFAGVV